MTHPIEAPARPVGRRREIGLALALNLVFVAGVLFWGWPAGNVLLLFWVENVLMGVGTLVRILTAEVGPQTRRPVFFTLHYGIFCVVHLVFVAVLSFWMGAEFTVGALLVPALLVLVRHAADLVTVWFGAGVRHRTTPMQAFVLPYPRMIVLHVTTILAWGLMLGSLTMPGMEPTGLAAILARLREAFAGLGVEVTSAGLVVVLLVLVKMAFEALTAGRPVQWTIGDQRFTTH